MFCGFEFGARVFEPAPAGCALSWAPAARPKINTARTMIPAAVCFFISYPPRSRDTSTTMLLVLASRTRRAWAAFSEKKTVSCDRGWYKTPAARARWPLSLGIAGFDKLLRSSELSPEIFLTRLLIMLGPRIGWGD